MHKVYLRGERLTPDVDSSAITLEMTDAVLSRMRG